MASKVKVSSIHGDDFLLVFFSCCSKMRLTFAGFFGTGIVRAWTSAPGGTKQ